MDRGVSGAGLARNLRLHYPPWLSYAAVGILLFANVINLAADIAAMGDALGLLIGGSVLLYTLMFDSICLAGVVFVSYAKFAKVLKFGTLMLLVYVIVAFAVHAPAREILAGRLFPKSFSAAAVRSLPRRPAAQRRAVQGDGRFQSGRLRSVGQRHRRRQARAQISPRRSNRWRRLMRGGRDYIAAQITVPEAQEARLQAIERLRESLSDYARFQYKWRGLEDGFDGLVVAILADCETRQRLRRETAGVPARRYGIGVKATASQITIDALATIDAGSL